MSLCLILGAGDFFGLPETKEAPALVIAADGGLLNARAAGLVPDLLIGDFDSLDRPLPEGIPVTRHPVEKDDTDMLLAVREGIARGCDEFLLLGGTGGRIDHTVANLQTLAFLALRGCRGWLIGRDCAITVVRSLTLPDDPPFEIGAGKLSVFAYGGAAEGVTLTGLKYSLSGARLDPFFPIGVSNEYGGGEASVTADAGLLLVTLPLKK